MSCLAGNTSETMKRIVLLFLSAIMMVAVVSAQNPDVESRLKSKFSQVQYYKECGGWYFISYSRDGQTLYGFADKQGNVIASDAYKYKLHKGFIELYILDKQKEAIHNQWKAEYTQYRNQLTEYKRVEAEYEATLNAYNVNVSAARTEAERRYKLAVDAAMKKAEYENKQAAARNSGGGVLGAVLSGLSAGLNTVSAASSVKFEPYFEQVKAERGLLVEPSKPYNPVPTEPKEPSNGYEWRKFCLLQPCPYDYIDFDKISEAEGFAQVSKDGKHGLVDAYMREVVPCDNPMPVQLTWDSDNVGQLITKDGYGIMDKTGKIVVKPQYSIMKRSNSNYIVRKGDFHGLIDARGQVKIPFKFKKIAETKNGEFFCTTDAGVGIYTSSYEELYPCQFQALSLGTINGKRYLKVKNKGLWGVVDFNTGTQLLPMQYSEINLCQISKDENGFEVVKNDKKGIYSDRGIIILPPKFESISVCENGNFEVKNGSSVGLYSSMGFEIIPIDKYKGYKPLSLEMFDVCDVNSGQHGVYIISGQEIVPCKYERITYCNANDTKFFKAEKAGNLIGIVSLLGEEMFPFVSASDCELVKDVVIIRRLDKKWHSRYGVCDFNGNELIAAKLKKKPYDKIEELYKKDKTGEIVSVGETKIGVLKASADNVIKALTEYTLKMSSFSYFAQNYVERLINEWQVRGEFEKKEDWLRRVNNETRQQKVFALTRDAQSDYIEKYTKHLPADKVEIVGQYDPDNETFRIHSSYSAQDLLVQVAPEDAQDFKTNFASATAKPIFFVENDYLGLAEYQFTTPSGKMYKYSNQASLNYMVANVDYNFDEIVIDASASNNNGPRGKQVISSSSMNIGTSDVDVAIPRASVESTDTYALIIANELYSNEKNVDYAFNDGQIFREYCIRALGIPEKNVQFRANATLNDMRFDVNWLKQMANVTGGDAKFIVYYAGHGMPDDSMKDSYLLPVDGYSADVNSGYKLSELYNTLSNLPAENVTVYLDACFSGSQRSGDVMASVRGVAVTPRIAKPKGNLMVFAATSGKETAQPYHEKHHGLFTYFLLKKIKEHNGTLRFGDLEKYVKTEVQKVALSSVGRKSQTPTVQASESLADWKTIVVK